MVTFKMTKKTENKENCANLLKNKQIIDDDYLQCYDLFIDKICNKLHMVRDVRYLQNL